MKYEYIKSDIESIKQYPKHWKIIKLKQRFHVIGSNVDKKTIDTEIPVELCNYTDVYYNDFIKNSIEFMEATATENEIKKFTLELNDVLITKDSEDPHDIGVPALVKEVKEKLLCGYHLSILKPKFNQYSGEFLFWVLKSKAIASQLYKEATGITRWAISSRNIKNLIIPFPPLEEQLAISEFLEKLNENINNIVRIKFGNSKITNDINERNQLKVLLEYRDSLIHECVTGKKQIYKGEI
ncbi:restriction endonuclease subunit S [Aliarcobacter butzleri]|uniref:restriction endonuclease subunit S n=1 Tax=Aliarcobacter butzleri TaxID=28197 RepID=UPI002B246C61|nr:restriction endonuclease subunit S [Aliarcobacter butzleri]